MSAGSRFEYHWQDGVRFRKPTKMSAPGEPPLMSWPELEGDNRKLTYRGSWAEYVDHLMTWVQGMLDDEGIFPSQMGTSGSTYFYEVPKRLTLAVLLYTRVAGAPFPKDFLSTVKSINRRLFRVYAHLYNHHFAQLCALSIEGMSGSVGAGADYLCRRAADTLLGRNRTAHLNTSFHHFVLFLDEVRSPPASRLN